jgi:hypothetical protein
LKRLAALLLVVSVLCLGDPNFPAGGYVADMGVRKTCIEEQRPANLLFPYVVMRSGFDTGLIVATESVLSCQTEFGLLLVGPNDLENIWEVQVPVEEFMVIQPGDWFGQPLPAETPGSNSPTAPREPEVPPG